MKKIILSLIFLTVSLYSFGQSGSQALSGIFLRVQDTATYQSAASVKHTQGYRDIYFNDQATTKHWDVWNGSSYDHVFSFNSGSGVGSDPDLQDVLDEGATANTLNNIDIIAPVIRMEADGGEMGI